MIKALTIIIIGILSLSFSASQAQENEQLLGHMLWKGIGGKTKWDSTNYMLFTAEGNNTHGIQKGRKFLIDTKLGRVRFEGKSSEGSNVIALFNYKTNTLAKLAINGETTAIDQPKAKTLFEQINAQFKNDISFLFLPALIEQADTKTGEISSKIVHAEKLQALPFQLHNGMAGEVLFNGETGWIKQFTDQKGNCYMVNDYKDIGDGLFLPTTFKNLNDQNKNLIFSTVAAFTDMEESRFTKI